MNPENYFEIWDLQQPVELARTHTSFIFKVFTSGQPAVLKFFTPLGQREEVNSSVALQQFDGFGSVGLLKFDGQAQLLNFVDGPFLKELSISGLDHEATSVASEVIKKLHTKKNKEAPALPFLSELFSDFLHYSQASPTEDLFKDGAAIASELLNTEIDKVVLHGDLHHKNIIKSSNEGWLAIDPKGYFGERTFDLANLFYNPDDQPMIVEDPQRIEEMTRVFSQVLALEPQRILKYAFAFGCLSAYWCLQDGLNPARRLRIARIIRTLISD